MHYQKTEYRIGKMKPALLLADGLAIPLKQLSKLRRGAFVLALDGAAERARKEAWKPDLILGDFDALSKRSQKHFYQLNVPMQHEPDQNFSDLEKGLIWLLKNGFRKITVAQFWGARLDHSFAAMTFLKKYHKRVDSLIAITGTHRLRYLENETQYFQGQKNGFAILPFPQCKAWTQGLEFELSGLNMSIGKIASQSNQARKKEIKIKIKGAALVMEEL